MAWGACGPGQYPANCTTQTRALTTIPQHMPCARPRESPRFQISHRMIRCRNLSEPRYPLGAHRRLSAPHTRIIPHSHPNHGRSPFTATRSGTAPNSTNHRSVTNPPISQGCTATVRQKPSRFKCSSSSAYPAPCPVLAVRPSRRRSWRGLLPIPQDRQTFVISRYINTVTDMGNIADETS